MKFQEKFLVLFAKLHRTFSKCSVNRFPFVWGAAARLPHEIRNLKSEIFQNPWDVSPETFHGFASHIRRIFKNLWEVCVGLPASAFPMKSKTFPGLFRPCACFSAQLLLHLLIFDLTQ